MSSDTKRKHQPSATPSVERKSNRRRWTLGVVLLIAVVAAALGRWGQRRPAAPPPPPPTVNTAGFDRAIVVAIDEARKRALAAPHSAQARGQLGMVLFAHEVRAEARECFAQASALAPGEARWPYFLGLAQLVDNPLAAATNLDRAVQLFPATEVTPRLKLADTLLNLGRLDEAEIHYRQVWQRDPKSAPAGLGLGKIANARDRAGEAIEFLNAAASDPSTRLAAHRLLLNAFQKLGRTNDAERVAGTLASLPNDTPRPDPLLAEIEALKTGEEVWITRADDWIQAGRVTDAARLLEKTIQAYPRSDRAMFFLGRARQRLGDIAGAEAVLANAVQIAPNSVEAQMQLGIVRLSRGQAKAAQPCFRAAIQSKPNLAQAWFNLGLSLGGESHRAECIAAFREAIRLKPNLVEAYLGLAVALRADGQQQAAALELHRALQLDPEPALQKKLLDQLRLVEAR